MLNVAIGNIRAGTNILAKSFVCTRIFLRFNQNIRVDTNIFGFIYCSASVFPPPTSLFLSEHQSCMDIFGSFEYCLYFCISVEKGIYT
jgi:hypothetical protein